MTVWDCTKSCGKQFSKLSKIFLSKKLGHCLIIFFMMGYRTILFTNTTFCTYMYVGIQKLKHFLNRRCDRSTCCMLWHTEETVWQLLLCQCVIFVLLVTLDLFHVSLPSIFNKCPWSSWTQWFTWQKAPLPLSKQSWYLSRLT